MREAWNRISATYQARHQRSPAAVHYGPWAPTERDLRLLGDVRGRRILELGCGGGQCCIALAKQGALAVGLDISEEQLKFARTLAAAEQVAVDFVQASAERLTDFQAAQWDIVFSVYTFQYIEGMPSCLAECQRVLRPGGHLVFSVDHPLRACFVDTEEDELALYPVRSYFDNTPMPWLFPETRVTLHAYHYTIAQWLDLLHAHGFQLRRLLEPLPPQALLDELWPLDGPYAALRNIPQTIIFVAEKL